MKTMSIVQFAQEVETAKARPQRISLFFRSLGLRFELWNTARVMAREHRRQRS